MSERRSHARKRLPPEPAAGSSSDAPRQYYASPQMVPPPQPPIYPPMYGPPHFAYSHGVSGSPQQMIPQPGYHHLHHHRHQQGAALSLQHGRMRHPAVESGVTGSIQQVTPDAQSFYPPAYASPPSYVRRRTFMPTGAGTLSPSKRQRRSGKFELAKLKGLFR